MRRLRQLAERTPATRERYADLLRALAITMVVLGHWGVTVIGYDRAGRPAGHSALGDLPWAWPLTWVAQVIPVFFLVGGYANAASLTARRRRGGTATGWLVDRSARLARPTTALLLVLAAGAGVATLRGADPVEVRTVVWFATIPLWFLVAYLIVVPLTPPMYALHRRFGLAVPLVLVGLVALGDLGRIWGPVGLATGNYVFGWLAVHQLGFAWYDSRTRGRAPGEPAAPRGLRRRRLPLSRAAGTALLTGGLVAVVLLTVVGPYPVAMLNVPGERLDNAAPPSLALLAVATAQLGLILLLREPAGRWLRRSGPWQATIAVNAVVLTVFLWHLTAAVLLVGLLDALGALPTPPVGSAAWWGWRVPWLLALAVVLAALVAVFGPIEARTRRPPAAGPAGDGARRLRTALAVLGYAGLVAGLLLNSLTRKTAPEPLGVPAPALVAYLAGAGVLRLLRSGWGSRG
ncbi:acyltransferase [Micromonospora chaiyaphumensis]|uniref:Peptidoglycan/LPS O-acetylase OafA/YrhL, contains acyltransferase and SGNH-hydrolase domains n=1 Tax=Micromonospora chaiyaphumensis TaxID=307119 RepID=A0A1C4UX18_9ACTN|nr:acyltransferase [Micromonospora chaiyaphumensis]SCE76257.1 Peptidoglycan/LPS O-acetylase OafA/YrhL, contains acyltransferase and SGNH-hydrolase domains [Micromonospora chaiyaphumensis]